MPDLKERSTARIDLSGGKFRVELSMTEKVLSLNGTLEIPFEHIASAKVEDEGALKLFWHNLWGASLPGINNTGIFWTHGGLAFVDYKPGKKCQCVVLSTHDERFKTVIVQPAEGQDADALVAEINKHLGEEAAAT
jgi:hypothetical protein